MLGADDKQIIEDSGIRRGIIFVADEITLRDNSVRVITKHDKTLHFRCKLEDMWSVVVDAPDEYEQFIEEDGYYGV
jgi:hypothetical protein